MTSTNMNTSMKLKLCVVGLNNRVLFAETSKETINILLKMLNTPIGMFMGMHTSHEMKEHTCGIWNLHNGLKKFNNCYKPPRFREESDHVTKLENLDDFDRLSHVLNADGNFKPIFNVCVYCSLVGVKRNNQVEYPLQKCPSVCKCGSAVDFYARNDGTLRGDIAKEEGRYWLMDNLKILSPDELSADQVIKNLTLKFGLNKEEIDSINSVDVNWGFNELMTVLKTSMRTENVLTNLYEEALKKEKEIVRN